MSDFTPSKYTRRNPYLGKNTLSLIDPFQFDALIRDQGSKIRYEMVSLCPCYYGRIDSGQKDPNCRDCENGYYVFDSVEIFAYIESTSLQKQFAQYGVWEAGLAKMYTPAKLEDGKTEFYIGYFDKITILDFLETYSEVVERGVGDTDYLSFKALDVRCLETRGKKKYQLDIDFKIDENGNIKWISVNQPTYNLDRGVGEAYTISYMRNPVYRVLDLAEENRFVLSGVKNRFDLVKGNRFKKPRRLVQECTIKKDFLISKQDTQNRNVSNGAQYGVQQG